MALKDLLDSRGKVPFSSDGTCYDPGLPQRGGAWSYLAVGRLDAVARLESAVSRSAQGGGSVVIRAVQAFSQQRHVVEQAVMHAHTGV